MILIDDSKIDWELLRKQKYALVKLIDNNVKSESLTSILNLIDNVQDNAVESGIYSKEEIFGNNCLYCGLPLEVAMVPDETGKGLHEETKCVNPDCPDNQ